MSYRKHCNRCEREILISKVDSEKWRAFELSGDPHLCQYRPHRESLVKECSFCSEPIELLKLEDRWRPYNEDKTLHRCIRRKDN